MVWNRKKYTRNLIGALIIVIALAIYFSSERSLLIIVGAFLTFEHLFMFKKWSFYDYLIGHEWMGIYLMVFTLAFSGYFVLSAWVLIGFLIGCDYEKFNTWKSTKAVIKEVFGK